MPTPDELAARAQSFVEASHQSGTLEPSYVWSHIDELIADLLDREYELFLDAEQIAAEQLLRSLIAELMEEESRLEVIESFADRVTRLIHRNYRAFDKFFLSQSQSRRQRAGGSFERHVAFLLRAMNIPFEEQKIVNGKPDFLIPNAALYRTNPSDVLLLTAKRTLRERWRQIIIEGARSPHYFLATIDERLTGSMIREAAQNRVQIVVPEIVIARVPEYRNHGNVNSFHQFLENFVQPTRLRWR